MSNVRGWRRNYVEERLQLLEPGQAIEVSRQLMCDYFDEFSKYDEPTAFGVSQNEILILAGHRPEPTAEERLERFCRKNRIVVTRPKTILDHWRFEKAK